MTTATLSRAQISHRKLSLAAGLIRNMKASDAVLTLSFQVQKSCQLIHKLLLSAIANAENNHNTDPDSLMIDIINIGPATRLKRSHARGRGRSAPIRKHYSNITITLKSKIN